MKRYAGRAALLLSLLGVLALAGCRSFPAPAISVQTADPADLVGLRGETLIDETHGNCMLHQLEAREEGLRATGGTGGVAFADGGATPAAEPAVLAAHLEAVLGSAPLAANTINPWAGGNDVAILVVDDFGAHLPGGPFFALGSDLFTASHAADAPDAAAFEALVEGWQESGDLTHGSLVYYQTLALVARLSGTSLQQVAPGQDWVRFSRAGIDVTVKAVDTQGFETTLIADAIEQALAALPVTGALDVAVNMSFSIVPCSVLTDYRYARDDLDVPGFDAYVEELTQVEENEAFAALEGDLLELVLTPVDELADPLHTLTSHPYHPPGIDDILFVASSGNYGLGYALAPAMWDVVLAAAASDVPTGARGGALPSSYSNNGEVLLPATWARVADAAGLSGAPTATAQDLVWAGTSGAAPLLAVYSALDLGKRTPTCGMADADTPALAHAMALETSAWWHRVPTLADAVDLYC